MNSPWDEKKISYTEDGEIFCLEGFTAEEIKRLSQLRDQLQRDHADLEDVLTSAEYRRLVFVRWLITTGKLSEQLD